MVVIKDMEMPKNCAECKLFHYYLANGKIHFICKCGNMEMRGDIKNKRNDSCPLIEVDKEKDVNCTDLCKSCNTKGCIFQSGITRSHCDFYKIESEKAQPKQTNDSCSDFDFDKVKEILKKDCLDNLIVDHTCEQTRDKKMIDAIDFAIKATDSQDDYSMGMRNGMRYVKSIIDGKEPQYELRRTDEEIKLGINLGDEVVGDYGAKGVVVGIDTYKGKVMLSLLMKNHKVPQLVRASNYKMKTGKHFPQIIEVLEQIKGETDGK